MDLTLVAAVVAAVVYVWAALLVVFWLARPKGVSVRELVRVIPDVVRLLRSIVGDHSAPLDVRIVLVGLVLWIVSPIDLIPEFIPGLGPLDDVVVAIAAFRYTRRRMGIADLERRWGGTPEGFALLARVIGSR